MGRKMKAFGLEALKIVDINAKGMGVGKDDGRVFFVPGTVPGDVVTATAYRKRRGYWEARLEKIEKPSPDRVNAPCDYFGLCGGCKWQHFDYQAQLQFKEKEVTHNLTHIGKVTPIEKYPIVAAPADYYYRNKMEFSFSSQRWLTAEEINSEATIERRGVGFHKPGMWDKVVDIHHCHLQADPSNAIRNFIRSYALEHNLSFFNPREQEGFLRTLMIRTASTGEVMVLLQFFHEATNDREALLQTLQNEFPTINCLLYCINNKANESLYDQEIVAYTERTYIEEKMGDLTFRISAKSFYQTNSEQAEKLYRLVKDFAQLQPNEIVYDLYTGTGTIAQYVADQCAKVIGIESVPDAIIAAKANALNNGISNVAFEVGDMKDCFDKNFIERHGEAQVVITDPPRNGMHAKVVGQLMELAPERIVYVSCNSATQARDLALMKEKYQLVKSQAVDLFPQTHHVENIVLLQRI
jgi:23S rRNA (uracil1939-C5)-methyltransferase